MSLATRVPGLASLRGYGREDLRGDLSAGLTTAVMLVPQGMAYAMLAGLPPILGLYASLLPLVAYALLGTSRQLAVGPVAMVSLLVAAGVGALAPPGTEEYVGLAVALSLLVAAIQLGMGAARLGFLVNFLSHPVISGFTSAAAVLIGLSQLQHLLGYPLPRTHLPHELLASALSDLSRVSAPTLAIGLGSVFVLLALARWAPRAPRALVVVVASTALVAALRLDRVGVAIVGEVPAGLPPLGLSWPGAAALVELVPVAVAIGLVGFLESIAVAKKYARDAGYEVDANRELVALGAANLAAALSSAAPVTGGLSRTAVNASAGARTGLAGLVTAGMVALTLLFFTPLFHFLPRAVLAAIIVTAVLGLVDVREVRQLWRVSRVDLLMLAVTFLATLALGIEEGITVGVVASLAAVVMRTTRPHVAVLGRLSGSDVYRNVARHPDAITRPGVIALRLDAQVYFGNVSFLKETLVRLEREAAAPTVAVVIDASGINHVDASGARAIEDLVDDYGARGVRLLLAGLKGPVRDVLHRAGLSPRLEEAPTVPAAMAALEPLCPELARAA